MTAAATNALRFTCERDFGSSFLSTFLFKHVRPAFFFGFKQVELVAGQPILLATPEKSLLDLVYLTPGADDPAYLEELRLDRLSTLDMAALQELARAAGRPKLQRAAARIAALAAAERGAL